jgi:hypothetical protein
MPPVHGADGRSGKIVDALSPESLKEFDRHYQIVKARLTGQRYIGKRYEGLYFNEWKDHNAAIFPVHQSLVSQLLVRRELRIPRFFYKPNYVISTYGYYLLLRHNEWDFNDHSPAVNHRSKKTPKVFPVKLIPEIDTDRFQKFNRGGFISYTDVPISIEGGHFTLISLDPRDRGLNDELATSAFTRNLMALYKTDNTSGLERIMPRQDRFEAAVNIFTVLPGQTE